MHVVVLPTGERIDLDGGIYVIENDVNVVVKSNQGLLITVPCTDSTTAASLLAAIDAYVATDTIISAIPVYSFSLTWTSVSPNTGSVAALDYSFSTVTGAGFLSSGINAMKLDDGGGNTFDYDVYVSIDSDTTITAQMGGAVSVASVYTLYFSTDYGLSWTTTGLTVTIGA